MKIEIRACLLFVTAWLFSLAPLPAMTHRPLRSAIRTIYLVTPKTATPQERTAARMLQEEVTRRSPVQWRTTAATDGAVPGAIIVLAQRSQVRRLLDPRLQRAWGQGIAKLHPAGSAEGFTILNLKGRSGPVWVIAGNDAPGQLFGVGWLLRNVVFDPQGLRFPRSTALFSAPEKPVRGYQVGYRMKNNTYDAWTLDQFEQQMRDMAVFGMNTVQVIAPNSDDAASSPLFHAPPTDIVKGLSRLSARYGLRYDLYYPEMATDYADPAQVEAELVQFEALVKELPRVDSLHIPGGDPGHTAPEDLFPLVEKEAAVLRRYHPGAQVWVSAQGFNLEAFTHFYRLLSAQPTWLTGVFFGPQTRESMLSERQRIPARYPLEFYPDIGHTMHAQFPVPQWDPIFALTEGREPVCPRPAAFAAIFRHFAPWNTGFLLYSEGVNDDVNKVVWAGLGWKAGTSVHQMLQQYAGYLLHTKGDDTDRAASAIEGLEQNWNSPLLDPASSITHTHALFASLPAEGNWRWNSLLFRDAYDSYLQLKRTRELASEQTALDLLRGSASPTIRVNGALQALTGTTPGLPENEFHRRLLELAAGLFREVGLQLSVPLYGASGWERGANLDRIDTPLNDAGWIRDHLREALLEPTAQAQAARLLAIANWRNPSPGTLYDDLGDPAQEPHLLRGEPWLQDPEMYRRAIDGIADQTLAHWRLSWLSYAETLYETPLRMRYTGLNPRVPYRLRLTYAGEDYAVPMQLTVNDRLVLQPMRLRQSNPSQVEYDLPPTTTHTGSLLLEWKRPTGLGGGGRGGQVAEVWLIPQTSAQP